MLLRQLPLCVLFMPSVNIHKLLRSPESPSAHANPQCFENQGSQKVDVVCGFGSVLQCYTVDEHNLRRIVDVSTLMPAPSPKRYGVFVDRNAGMGSTFAAPIDKDFTSLDLKGSSLALLYDTAGEYHTPSGAMRELVGLPKRGNKSTSVCTYESDGQGCGEEDEDEMLQDCEAEHDEDEEKRPRKKSKLKSKARKKADEANANYRREIIAEQSRGRNKAYTACHLGDELCAVLSQMLRCLEDTGHFSDKSCVFLYGSREWRKRVRRQSKLAGNASIAEAVTRMNDACGV